ncbi:MAG TPA: hypothetical protein VKZ18_23175 [Polyangia bacterium]|nr:hypothetical protein [Polyangia bacterium]
MDRPAPGRHDERFETRRPRRFLPNLLVPIDLRDGEPTPPSLFALAEGRRVAHVAGVTVYAIAMSDRDLDGAVVAQLGRAGADKVLLCEGAALGAPPLDATHGPALLAAVERISPLLVLFPAGGAGLALGPTLAARLGAAFAGLADIEVATSGPLPEGVGRVYLRRWRAGRSAYRRLDPVEIERPVVAILGAGVLDRPVGGEGIDVEVIACAPPKESPVTELASEPDPAAQVPTSRVLVIVDPSLGAEARSRLAADAPEGVAVVDREAAAAAIAASAPEIVIVVGDADLPSLGTPRGRVGAILLGDATTPPARGIDVLWRVPATLAGEALWSEIAGALTAVASRRSP